MPKRPASLGEKPRKAQLSTRRAEARARGERTPRLYDKRQWRRLSPRFKAEHPLCVKCLEQGIIERGVDVDHIVPHNDDPALQYDESNLQTLCKRHHFDKTSTENGGRARASLLPRFIEKPVKHLIVVCGPPAAGKTTHVLEHAQPGDLVLDQDELALEIEGEPYWSLTEAAKDRILRARNSRLADFCKGATAHPRCWLIATASSFKQRRFWADLGADLVVIHPGVDECLARIDSETRRPEHVKPSLRDAVRRWS